MINNAFVNKFIIYNYCNIYISVIYLSYIDDESL